MPLQNAVRQTVGRNARALREARGMSQKCFAEMIGVNRAYYNRVELGLRNISMDLLVKIASGLDVPLTWLFSHSGIFEGVRDQ